MRTYLARRASLLLVTAVVLLAGVACDVAWEPISQTVIADNGVAVARALRVPARSENVDVDEVAGIAIEFEAQHAGTPGSDGAGNRSRGLFDSLALAPVQDGPVDPEPAVAPSQPPPVPTATSVPSQPIAVPTATPVPPQPTAVPTATPVPPPPTARPVAPPSTYGERGRAALATLRFSPADIGYTVSFLPGRDGYLGLTHTTERRVEVYVRSSMSTAQIAYIIGHELGHAVDHIRNSNADRDQWMAARGINPSTAWWPNGLGSDLSTPAGDFAECFASWAVGSASHSAWGACGSQMGLMSELAAG